jgi:hypothetical protein
LVSRDRAHRYPWYDSWWLERYTRARSILAQLRPSALREFDELLAPLHTRPDFHTTLVPEVFPATTRAHIDATVGQLKPAELELHEARNFGRFVVHDHAVFTELHHAIVPMVEELTGEPVEPTYNFLSLYTQKGRCRVHLDAPSAKWTLDFCVAQSTAWPIYFSQVVPWPERELAEWQTDDWETAIKRTPGLSFTPFALEPGQAVLFSGSSQWHYRDPFPASSGFCHLLFFHFAPRGARDLLNAAQWAERFGVPELGGL